ncbi:histidine kinase [Streptomyces sp. NPDC097619]|uniref:sensor histidine kinase n=1 Tax=Streptomyces sp. NPDC097619 TaxID=3157228 RepID=UPI00332B4F58
MPVPEVAVPGPALQLNALQALCRQVFGFRLAMIALGTPIALGRTAPGAAGWLVGGAVLLTFMGSYVLFRDWERFGPYLLRHPWVLAVDMAAGTLLLVTATPGSPLGLVCVCTPLLAGLVHGWRGSGGYAAVQALIVLGAHAVTAEPGAPADGVLLLAGLCLIAGAAGVSLRTLLFRFGAAGQALTEARARLAVTEAVAAERARLAREMHDSVAKTLHGLALAADGLAATARAGTDADAGPVGGAGAVPGPRRPEGGELVARAETVARAARRAATESRALLADLRRAGDLDGTDGVPLDAELRLRVAEFTRATGIPAEFRPLGTDPLPPVPHAVARPLLGVAAEALENAGRHSGARRVRVEAGLVDGFLRIGVLDDGRGLPTGTTLEELREAGHFGLLGMVERAAATGARLRIGRGRTDSGTEVRLDLPAAALRPLPPPAAPPSRGGAP